MRLSALFPAEAICVGLRQRTKSELIESLVLHAAALGRISSQELGFITQRILEREELASTALGHGLALPHCQWPSLQKFVGVAGFLDQGIPFEAADGEPVDGVFLVISPSERPRQAIDLLGRLVAVARNGSLRVLLRERRSPTGVAAFLEEIDQPVSGHLEDLARMSLSRSDEPKGDPWRDLGYFSLTRGGHPGSERARPPRRWI